MRRMREAASSEALPASPARVARAAATELPTALPFAAECLSIAPAHGSRATHGRFLSRHPRRLRAERHRECAAFSPTAKRDRQLTEARAARSSTDQPPALQPLADCTRARIVRGALHYVALGRPRLRAPADTRVNVSPARRVDPPRHPPPRDAATASAP